MSKCAYCSEQMRWWGYTCDKCKEKIAIQRKLTGKEEK